nr:hypothetical protein B0A51_10097 [Rachicladosporium sp. CCFEE 5018]
MPSLADHCSKLANPNVFAVGLAGFLVLGILVSYIPQHAKIITRRSSEGLSPWWVLLGGLSSIAAIGNILTLPSSRDDIHCCKELSGGACAAALLGVAQIGCQWACFMFVVMLFLIFFPEAPDMTSSAASITSTAPPKRRDALIVGVSTLVCLLTVGIASIAIVAVTPHHTQAWANLLGIVAGALSAVQYLPQIWYTFRLGDIKSLSIITMLIQVPGAFVFAFSLWLRVGWEGWSTWLVYIITGLLQGTLLGLAISYWLARHRADKDRANDLYDSDESPDAVDGAAEEHQASERTALLGSRRGTAKSIQKGSQRSRQSSNGRLGMLILVAILGGCTRQVRGASLAGLDRLVNHQQRYWLAGTEISARYVMVGKLSNNTGSKGTAAIDRTKPGRVASELKAAQKTIIGISDQGGQHIRGAPQQSTAQHRKHQLVEEVAKAKNFQSLLKNSAFFANDTCTFTSRTGDLTNELHPVFQRADFADASHHELLIPTLRLATRLLGHASVRRLMRTIIDHRPTAIGELDDQRKPLHEYPDDGRTYLTRQQEMRVDAALAELADIVRFVDDSKLAKGHGTTEADNTKGSNKNATHLTGVCNTTKYGRKNYLFLKIILNEAREKYDPPLVMAWQFQLAVELVHEVCHALFIARCGNVPEGDTDIFFRNDALAEVGFAMEDRLLGGHLSLMYDQDKVYHKVRVSCHMKAHGKPSRFIGIMVLWD